MSSISSRQQVIVPLLLLTCLALSISRAFGQGKGHGVEVRATTATLLEGRPGDIVSSGFLVTNNTDAEEELLESLALPPGWPSVGPLATLIVGAGKQQVRIAAFQIPTTTPAGPYEVTYSVRSQRDYAIQDADTIKVQVLAVSDLSFLLEEKPDTVIAGDEYEVKLRIVNRGNSETRTAVSAASTQRFPVVAAPADVALPPGGTQVISVRVKTDSQIDREMQDVLQIEARAVEPKDGGVLAGLTVVVDIVPAQAGKIEAYHRVPAGIELRQVMEDDESGFQMQIAGAGTLDETGDRSVDFLLRGPDVQSVSPFGLRDEYRMNYYGPHLDVLLGDQTYGLSYLTDYYRYGRGAGVRVKGRSGLDMGAFYLESRWLSPKQNEAGVHVARQVSDSTRVKLNYLNKDEGVPVRFEDRILSIEANVKTSRTSDAEVEIAASDTNREDAGSDNAYRVALEGSLKGAYYTLGKIHAGPDYHGYYSSTDYTNGTVTFPIAERLRGHVSMQRWEQNLDREASLLSAPKETFYQAHFEYALLSGLDVSLGCERFRRRDYLTPVGFDFEEDSVRLGVGRSFGKSNLQAYLQLGNRRDLLAGSEENATRCSLYYSVSPSYTQHFGFFAQLGDRSARETRLLGGSNTIGVSGSWRMASNLSMSLQYMLNGVGSGGQQDLDYLYLTAGYQDLHDRLWTLRLRRIDQPASGADTSLMLSCTIPWDIRASRKRSVGAIKGRVYDEENPEHTGIPRVIVTAGNASVATNGNGEFRLSALPPGPCRVTIKPDSIGLDRVPSGSLPVLVEVKGGETVEVQIGVTRAAALAGRVARFAYANDASTGVGAGGLFVQAGGESGHALAGGSGADGQSAEASLVEEGAVSNILVELSDGSQTVRTLTDSRGRFSFDAIRPGDWTVKAYDHNLPAYHYFDKSETQLVIGPGDRTEVEIRVLPRLRPIQVVEEGVLTSTE